MQKYVFTLHARDMLKERDIPEQWVLDAISAPDEKNIGSDDNTHFFKSLPERENRILHVVVNENVEPNRIVTLFLDRRRSMK